MLGGPPTDRRTHNQYNGKHKGKFANRMIYNRLLISVFERALRGVMRPDAIVYVRTDRRKPTLAITREALKKAFPKHSLKEVNRPVQGNTQTRLFGNGDPRFGEVDLLLTPKMKSSSHVKSGKGKAIRAIQKAYSLLLEPFLLRLMNSCQIGFR